MDSGAVEIALQHTSFFYLSFLSFSGENYQGNIGDNDVSIQISLIPCLCWMFASCVRKMKKRRKDQIIYDFLQMPAASYR
jgi:hypothetical protein